MAQSKAPTSSPFTSGFLGFFSSVKITDVVVNIIASALCSPTRANLGYSGNPRFANLAHRIFHIGELGDISDIAKSIVRLNPVNMVNKVLWPSAMGHSPNNSMTNKSQINKACLSVTFAIKNFIRKVSRVSFVPSSALRGRPFYFEVMEASRLPAKPSGFFIQAKEFAQC